MSREKEKILFRLKSSCVAVITDPTYATTEMSTREVVDPVYTELSHPEYMEIVA